MIKSQTFTFVFLFIFSSCGGFSSLSSSSLSGSTLLSSQSTLLTTISQVSEHATLDESSTLPSVSSSGSTLSSSNSVTLSPSSAQATLNNIWVPVMGGIDPNSHYQILETLPSTLNEAGITLLVSVYNQNNIRLGFGYEAVVNGNGGTIRFRVGLANNLFVGFVMVSHREHASFGVRLINALNAGLVGQVATIDTVKALLASANATRGGISETYDGMIPAIEAMTLHYSLFQA